MDEGQGRSPRPSIPGEFLPAVEAVLDAQSHLVALIDRELRYRWVNRRYADFHGGTPEDYAGQRVDEVLSPDVFADIRAHMQAALAGEHQNFVSRATQPGGAEIRFRIACVPARGADGAVAGFFAVVEDVRPAVELHAQEHQQATLLDTLPGMVYRCSNDPEWPLEFTNAGCEALTGHPAEALLSKRINYGDLIHPGDRERVWAEVQAGIEAGQPFEIDYRIRTADGTEKRVWERGVGLFDPKGQLLSLQGFIHDVTAQRLAEEKYRSIMETALEGVWVIDLAGKTTFANPAMERMLGLESGSMIGRSFLDFMDEESRAIAGGLLAERREGVARVHDFKLMTADGDELWVCMSTSPIRDPDGNVVEALAMVSDVTERRRAEREREASEERFRQFAEAVPYPVAVTRVEDGVVAWANPACAEFVGIPVERLLGARAPDFYRSPAHREALMDEMRRLGRVDAYELELTTASGEDRTVLISMRPVEHRGSRHLVTCITDITQTKHKEAEHAALLHRLHHAQRMEAIGTLASGISHDFNNILSPILMFTHMLETTRADSAQHDAMVAGIRSATMRAVDLVGEILAFSRHEPPKPRSTDLVAVVREAAQLLRASFPDSVVLQLELPSEPTWARVDASQIHQVVMNLGVNAGHAVPAGGHVTIALSDETVFGTGAFGTPPRGKYIKLEVRDDGEGIPPQVLPRVFEPFFTTKGSGRGTGMGLPMVQRIVNAHQGYVSIESSLGEGAVVRVLLPTDNAPDPQDRVEGDRAGTRALVGGLKVLVVDDDASVAESAARCLEQLGSVVTVSTGPGDALSVFEEDPSRFDVAVLDQGMPGQTGAELAQALRRLRPGFPIVLCSGKPGAWLDAAAHEAGVGAVLAKPYSPSELVVAIARART